MFQQKNNYPVILVPGVVGFGKKMETIIKGMDVEVYKPSFSLTSGIWDRACELYAQIKGGTVDYGAAHSEKFGTQRYGKTYPGFVSDWGETSTGGALKKVNLVAYGAGVPVARLLAYLLAKGSVKEQATEGEISPLFQGGKGTAIHAVVSLAGINEGTTLFQAVEYNVPGITKKLTSAAFTIDGLTGGLGVSKYGNGVIADSAVEKYLAAEKDNLLWDLGLDGMKAWNRQLQVNPDCYYFAYTGEVTKNVYDLIPKAKKSTKKHGNPFTEKHAKVEIKKDISIPTPAAGICCPTAALMGTFKNYLPDAPIATPEMHPNDGAVNTAFSMAPLNEPVSGFSSAEDCVPGTWYQMPVEEKNHLAFIGVMQRPDTYRNEVYDMIKMICNLETV